MRRSLLVPTLLLGMCFALTMSLLSFTGAGRIAAQEFPPFPTLYGGHVWINDDPAPPGTVLVARVGDYEAMVLVEEDGHYRNLLVQPQSSDYHDLPITFHALGTMAQEGDTFLEAGGPVFKTAFDFHFQLPKPESSPPAPVQTASVPRADQESAPRSVLLITLLIAAGVAVVAGALVTIGRRYRHR